MKKKTWVTIELVVWFGFINGTFVALGLNPRDDIFNFMEPYAHALGPDVRLLFSLLPLILTSYILYHIYHSGGFRGFLATGLGFLGGVLILADLIYAVSLLVLSWFIGKRAVMKKR